ncbi:MAG TPA: pilin [Candidatus Saccharimonadales bacterium]|nr:pilin [Candidatus Saccharimonadales bacterium]
MLTSLRKRLLVLGASLFMLATPVAAPVAVYAADIEGNLACGTVDLEVPNATKNCKSQLSGGTSRINKIITQAINIFSIIVGIVAVIMIIVGGFKYITSGGDSGNVTSAKQTIIYAVIGLVIVALAQFLVQFVLDKASQ